MTKEQRQKKREEFIARGINLRAFCAEKNIDYQAARELMCGKSLGRRGKAHQAAVVLGLKPDPDQQPSA
jgi:gp16 family phage-associated protein